MPSISYDIAVIGEVNPDLIITGGVFPEFGQVEKLVDSASMTIGSSSAIFACGAARLGLRVAFIGKIGGDIFGQFMRRSLEGYGIDTHGMIVDRDCPTGISIILSKGRDRAILTYPGTIPKLTRGEVDYEIICKSRHVHVGSYYLQDALRPGLPDLFSKAHKAGASTSLDTNFDPTGRWNGGIKELLGRVDVFLPNAVECQAIAKATDLDTAVTILSKNVKYLGVKDGKNGALLSFERKIFKVEAIKVDILDTIGAGDSFDAGFIYGYLAGWEPEKILKFANACGGLSTRRAGGTAGQATLTEAQSYL
jgi:sugar/nucleoside kinase (ribokinase family)